MRYHNCAKDPECQQFDAPKRYYLSAGIWSLVIAQTREDWAQLWLPFLGWTLKWSPVALQPSCRATGNRLKDLFFLGTAERRRRRLQRRDEQ